MSVVIIIGLLIGIVCDFVPVIILLAYHYKNFNYKAEATEQDFSEEEIGRTSQASSEVVHLALADKESTERSNSEWKSAGEE